MPRPWSAMIRCAFVAFSELVHATPLSASIQSISAWKPSVSYTVITSCWIAAVRSSPRPVSITGLGRGVNVPSTPRSNSMKTRFQNSR